MIHMLKISDKTAEPQAGLNVRLFKFILAVVYAVGILGMAFPASRFYFQLLTPFHLLLSTVVLLLFHKDWGPKFILFACLAFLIGFGAEVIGVQTGVLFGEYTYGTVLGPKLFGVPLLIGVNWFLLVYVTGALVHNYIRNDFFAAVLAALLMVFLDFLIEPVAISLEFWAWEAEEIPLSNYIGWFAIALLIQIIYRKIPFEKQNPIAIFMLLCLAVFFSILALIL